MVRLRESPRPVKDPPPWGAGAYTRWEVTQEWIAVLQAGCSLIVSLVILFVSWRILRSTRRAKRGGEERLEILRQQQGRPRVLYQERRIVQEELEWLRTTMDEVERSPLELLPPGAQTEDSGLHNGVRHRSWAFRR